MNLWWLIRVARSLLGRPSLWGTACRQVHRFAHPGWWRRAPFLPLPARTLAGFRSVTQYGDTARIPDIPDVLTWLVWAKEMERGWSEPSKRIPGPDY